MPGRIPVAPTVRHRSGPSICSTRAVTRKPIVKNTRQRVLSATGVLAVLVLGGLAGWSWYVHIVDSRNAYGGHNSFGMRDYTPEMQEKAAIAIVNGLNTRNPDNVEQIIRNHSGDPDREADNARITQNLTAVLPPPGCQYTLVSIEDQGEQDPAAVPWFSGPTHARGFDMKLQQLCPAQQSTSRIIRVIAIPSGMGGYWAEAALWKRD